jgi:hypothetical protein
MHKKILIVRFKKNDLNPLIMYQSLNKYELIFEEKRLFNPEFPKVSHKL